MEQQCDIRCTFEVSRIADLCNGIFIQFSNFILKCGLGFDTPLEMCTLDGRSIASLEIDDGAESIAGAFFLEWRDFIDQCISGYPSTVSADSARHSTALIEECYQSAEFID